MPTLDAMTLHEAKLGLGLDGTSDEDPQLQRLVTAVTLEVERRLGTQFVRRAVVELHEGGIKRIYPQVCPVVSVTSVVDPAGNTVPSTDYAVRRGGKWLEHIGSFPTAYDTNGRRSDWIVTYVAGWFADTASVAADVKSELLRALSSLRSVAGQDPSLVSSVGVGDLSVSYRGDLGSVHGVGVSNPVLDGAVVALSAFRGVFL